MAIDLREKNNYFFLIKNGKVYDEHKRNVKILKDYEDSTKYSILFNDKVIVPGGIVWDKVTLDGSPFDSQEEFETWAYENTGFKTASGGSGAATSYNELTDKSTVDLPTINTPLANALADKEDKVNKQTDLTSTDAEHYPNVPAVKVGINDAVTTANNYTDAQIAGLPYYIPLSEKGDVNGVAELDATGKVPLSQLPPISNGVQSVTGDGVSGTPENPVLTFPTLQEVTDKGSSTTNTITVTDSDSTHINIDNEVIESFYPLITKGFRLSENTLSLGKIEKTEYTAYHKTKIEYKIGFGANGTLLYPNLGNTATEETIATQEWVSANGVGSGVQSVTGDGVSGTPENPVINYPTASDINAVTSDVTSEPTGSDKVVNMVSLTQAEYDAGTPNPQTFYIITDA